MKTLFDLERSTGIGGSDAGATYSLGFLCARKTAYEKRNTTPDFPKATPAEFERGTVLEPVIKHVYELRTKRKVILKDMARHPDYPYMIVHVDGETTAPEHAGPGYVEFKCVNRFALNNYKKKGIRDEYTLQLQHGMAVMGYSWGSFGILCLDPWEFHWFDVDRDEELIQRLIIDEGVLWKMITEGPLPEPLPDVKDSRCQTCQFRRTCRNSDFAAATDSLGGSGEALVPRDDLAPLLSEITELRGLKDEATALHDEAIGKLKTEIGDAYGIVLPGYRAYFPTAYSERWDTKALEQLRGIAEKIISATADPFDYDALEVRLKDLTEIATQLMRCKKPPKPERSLRIYPTGD
jgi:predicted phage-related endonuclease